MTDSTEKPPSKSLSGLHLLLTYECNYECDHCFVWGGPTQTGTMTLEIIGQILEQATALGTIEWIYFEGGEPFLYYDTLLAGVRQARESGFRVGIVSNAYWATSDAEAEKQLQPLVGLVEDLSISSDAYHGKEDGIIFPDIARGPPYCSGAGLPKSSHRALQGSPGSSSTGVPGRTCEHPGACTSTRSATCTFARAFPLAICYSVRCPR
jgi:hypothetical protein